MKKYTKTKVIRISEIQHNTLKKMKTYKVYVCKFIRDAISEKLQREGHEITRNKNYCPFSNGAIEL